MGSCMETAAISPAPAPNLSIKIYISWVRLLGFGRDGGWGEAKDSLQYLELQPVHNFENRCPVLVICHVVQKGAEAPGKS